MKAVLGVAHSADEVLDVLQLKAVHSLTLIPGPSSSEATAKRLGSFCERLNEQLRDPWVAEQIVRAFRLQCRASGDHTLTVYWCNAPTGQNPDKVGGG